MIKNGLIIKKDVEQLFDKNKGLFLADRFIKGTCPKCHAEDQYGDNCQVCGATYDATELLDPRSVYSGEPPELKKSEHLFFDLAQFDGFLNDWLNENPVRNEVANKLREWLEDGLRPWDISRDAPYFGFQIPGENEKFFYVWMDAPIGYLASLRTGVTDRRFPISKIIGRMIHPPKFITLLEKISLIFMRSSGQQSWKAPDFVNRRKYMYMDF